MKVVKSIGKGCLLGVASIGIGVGIIAGMVLEGFYEITRFVRDGYFTGALWTINKIDDKLRKEEAKHLEIKPMIDRPKNRINIEELENLEI